jgi:ketosteroid isomerase-like protein
MTSIETIHAVFAAVGAGDIDTIIALLVDEVQIEFYERAVLPDAGCYQGRAEARGFFETVFSVVDIHQFGPMEFFGQGEKIAVTSHPRLTARSTGGGIKSDFAHVITVRDGKWLRFRDDMDTAAAVAAFSR